MNRNPRVVLLICLGLCLTFFGACERHSYSETAPFAPRHSPGHGQKPKASDDHEAGKPDVHVEPKTFVTE